MAMSYGGVLLARASSTGNPISVSVPVTPQDTPLVLFLKTVGATDRAGGAPTIDGVTMLQVNTVQKAAASPEASCEMWYLENHTLSGSVTLSIPNTGALTVFRQVVSGRPLVGGSSVFRSGNGGNATSTNPTPGSVECGIGDITFATTAGGWQTWAPSAQAGTVIHNTDDGAHGAGSQYSLRTVSAGFTLNWTFGTSEDWGAIVGTWGEVPPNALETYHQLGRGPDWVGGIG